MRRGNHWLGAGQFRVLAALAAVGALAACSAAPPGRVAGWRRDIAFVAAELPRVHVDGLTGVSRPTWESAAARLEAQVPHLSNGQVILGIRRVVALLRDDETHVNLPPAAVYPLALEWVGGGLCLVAVPSWDRRLLGARLLAVDGHPTGQILAELRPDIPYQDPGVLAAAESDEVIEANVLHWLGVASSPRSADFTVRTVAGMTVTVRLAAGQAETQPWAARALGAASGLSAYFPRQRWLLTAFGSANLVHVPLPLFEQNLMDPYWMRVLPGGVVYLKYNECLDTGGFGGLAARTLALLRSHPAYRLIVDLRNNPGGDTEPFGTLVDGIRADPAINKPGRIIALVNPLTDSSATLDAANLARSTQAILIGQVPEDPIDEYGNDTGTLTLPYGGITITYTTKVVNPSKATLASPDVVVAPSLQQILTGRDPVLQAALAPPP